MAGWDGAGGRSEPDEFMRPRSPRHRMPRPPSTLLPDTEEHVSQQTSDVFRNFIFQSYRQDQIRQEYDNMPSVPVELTNISPTPQSPSAEIGRQLARIGDDINEQYADVFNDMIYKLNLTPDTAYETFEGVARKLLENEMNWGRICMLLFFGYRMAISVLRTHFNQFSDFLGRITQYVVRFIVRSKIAKWIADHGGWRGALSFVPSSTVGQVIFVGGLACVSVLAVFYFNSN